MSKYSIGQMNQLGNALEKAGFTSDDITKLMTIKLEVVKKILYDELILRESACKWREENGVIYLTVTSNDLTGEQWIKRLESKKINIGSYAKSVLLSNDFKPTNGVIYEIAILKGVLFEDKNRVNHKIRAEAEKRNLTKPNVEVACLIRENFSDEEIEKMGLDCIVVMHKSIKDSDGDPNLLGVRRYDNSPWLGTYFGDSRVEWCRERGFAFVRSLAS